MTDRIEQIEIQLGHLCNNRCVFCSSGLITSFGLAGQEAPTRALEELESARAAGARKVTFVGGEPTLQREFPRLLERARELGYQEIVVFTNGVRTHQPGYLASLCAGGPLTFRVSIQGGDRATHDRVTGRPGAFDRILGGLEEMRALGQKITANACLNVLSYESVSGYPELAERYGISEVHLDQINPLEIGNRPPGHLGTILVRYSEEAPHLARMLAEFERRLGADYDVNLGNLPFCVMPEWAHRIHHAGEETTVVSANLGGLAPSGHDKYARKTEHKLKPATCASCVFDPICTGVFVEYAEKFGTDELVSVPAEQLRSARNAPRLFTLLEAPRLTRLSRAAPPSDHLLTGARWRPGEASARFEYVRAGRPVALVLRHRRSPGAPIGLTGRVALFAEAAEDDDDVSALAAWALEVLAVDDDPVELWPRAEDTRRRLAWGRESRARLASLCDALASRRELGGLEIVRERRSADGEEVVFSLEGSATGPVRLRLETEPPFRSPRVRARVAALAPEAAAGAAESVLRALRSAI
ncbi:MAG: radical SAM protein [Sorangiineae bacterium]|nr:radical SAM protein [Polyangiaceae bacterium]MEB2321827.1 radical SAM protein [Sorangiineae bacterium]